MHDIRLENQLRAALHAEGDDLPMTISTEELERRLALRRRERNSQRLTLLAAAVAVVAVGSIVAIGNGWLRKPAVGIDGTPSPATSPFPTVGPSMAPTPSATPVASMADLRVVPPPAGTIAVDHQWEPDAGISGDVLETTAGEVPSRSLYRVAFACVGTGSARWDIGLHRLAGGGEQPCDGAVRTNDASEGSFTDPTMAVIVTTSPRNRWHIVVSYEGDAPRFPAPQLFAAAGPDVSGDTAVALPRCVSWNTAGDQCALPYLARDGATEVQFAPGSDLELGLALADGWRIDSAGVDVMPREIARTDPFGAYERLTYLGDGGVSIVVPLDGLRAGEWVVRLSLTGSKGTDTMSAVYEIPVVIEG
jgi:hypothetical protein